jgi:hypothetical protein
MPTETDVKYHVYIDEREPINQENLLEFRLLYEGELLSSGNKPKPENKHAIRKILHPQLRHLWKTQKSLRQYAEYLGSAIPPNHGSEEERIERGLNSIGINYERAGYKCIPLVTESFALRCSVDILILRPDETQVIHKDGGDLDGKVKTIFDALQMPKDLVNVGGVGPQQDETPFYCLLEDDKLITEFRVAGDRLLSLPGERSPKASDSFILIQVKINHRGGGPFDRWFD